MGISCELSFQEHGKGGGVQFVYIYLTQLGRISLIQLSSLSGFHWGILERPQGVKKNDSPRLHFDHTGTCRINSEFRMA